MTEKTLGSGSRPDGASVAAGQQPTSRTVADWMWPFLIGGVALFSISALFYYHFHRHELQPEGVLQVSIAGLYDAFGWAPLVVFFLLVFAWSLIWFVTGVLEKPLQRLARLALMALMLGVFLNLGDGGVVAEPHKGAFGAWFAGRLVFGIGYVASLVIVWVTTFASLLLATDWFFSEWFERGRKLDGARAELDVGVEGEVADHLRSIATSESPAASTPSVAAARSPAPFERREAEGMQAAATSAFADGELSAFAGTDEDAPESEEAPVDAAEHAAAPQSTEVEHESPSAATYREVEFVDEDDAEVALYGEAEREAAPSDGLGDAQEDAQEDAPEDARAEPAGDEDEQEAEDSEQGWSEADDEASVALEERLQPRRDSYGEASWSPHADLDAAGAEESYGDGSIDESPLAEPTFGEAAVGDSGGEEPAVEEVPVADELHAPSHVDDEDAPADARADAPADEGADDAEPVAPSAPDAHEDEAAVLIPRPDEPPSQLPTPPATAAERESAEAAASRRQQQLFGGGVDDELVEEARELLQRGRRPTASLLQRKLRIDYDLARELLGELRSRGLLPADQGE